MDELLSQKERAQLFILSQRSPAMAFAHALNIFAKNVSKNLDEGKKQTLEELYDSFQQMIEKEFKSIREVVDDIPALMESLRPLDGSSPDPEDVAQVLLDNPDFLLKVKGEDGSSVSKEEATEIIRSLIPEPVSGITPVKGKDYFTKKEVSEIIDIAATIAATKVKVPETKLPDMKSPEVDMEAIVEYIIKNKKIREEHIDGLKQTVASMWSQIGKKGYLHGGGDTIKAGNNIILTRNSDGTVTITSTGSGSTSFEIPVGSVNDSNIIFTVSNTPKYIIVNGAQYLEGTGIFSSYSAGTITLAYPVGTGGFIRSAY